MPGLPSSNKQGSAHAKPWTTTGTCSAVEEASRLCYNRLCICLTCIACAAAPSNAHADWHANSSSRIKHGKPIEVSFCSLISTNISASRNIALISVLKLDLGRHARPPHLSALYCSSSKSFHCILCGMQSSNTTCTMRWKARFCNCWIMPENCWCLPEFANVFALHLPVHAKSCCPLVSDPHHTVRQPLRLRYHVIPCAKSSPVYQSGGLIFGST